MIDALRSYLQLASGLAEVSAAKAKEAAATLAAQGPDTPSPEALTVGLQTIAEDLVEQSRTNTDILVGLVKTEVDRAVGRMGFVREEELAAVRRHVQRLEAQLGNRSGQAVGAAGSAVNAATVGARSAAATAKTAANAAASAARTAPKIATKSASSPADAAPVTPKPAAKKAPAKKAATKKAPAKKAPAKKVATKKAPGGQEGGCEEDHPHHVRVEVVVTVDSDGFSQDSDRANGQQLEVVNVDTMEATDEAEVLDVDADDVELLASEADRLEELHDELRAKLVGQDQQQSPA